MPMRWKEQVRSSGMLKVHCDQQIVGDWAQVVNDAMTSFNSISSRESLGVTFVSEPEVAPANVIVWTVSGSRSTVFDGTTYQVNLPASASSGHTSLYSIAGRIQMAHVFLPATPGQYPHVRGLGRPVRLVLAFHELVHCCGLHNSDHGTLAFHGTPSATRGQTASEDRVSVRAGGRYVHMPPLVVSSETCRAIQNNWSNP